MRQPPPSSENPSPNLAEELDQVILDFEDLQSKLVYDQAKNTLQSLLDRLDLTPREASSLEHEVQRLTNLRQKLEETVIHIAVFGLVGRGKSSLLNALAGASLFVTGPIHGVTQQVAIAPWVVNSDLDERYAIHRVILQGTGQSRIELVDTPGLDEVGGEARAQLATHVAGTADLILFVIAGDMTRVEYEALMQLRQASKPMLLVFNKVDQYPEADRQAIYTALQDQRLRDLISPDEIVMAAAAPLTAVATPQPDGRLKPVIQRGEPQIETLKLKILDILHREGLALVALNTLLYADDLNETILAKKLYIRDQTANEVIWNSVMSKAIAVALNPITVLDVLTGAIVDLAMIVTLSRLYGLPLTQTGAVQLLRTIAIELGGLSVSELLVTLGLGSLKSALGASVPATGGLALAPYTSVAIAQAAVVGVATYGIGQVTKNYLANGAKWGEQGPKATVQRILATLDETSILNRIKTELTDKLNNSSHLG
ncbi:MAG: GTP-binding protein [Cyanobacteria bacterium P01_H01_bin.58]